MNLFFSESDISDSEIYDVIRPRRMKYSTNDLGTSARRVKNTMMLRKDFEVLNDRKEKLQCSLFFPKEQQQSNLLVIYLHGNSGCRLESIPVVNSLIPHGYHVCAFDSAACGLSEGQFVTFGLREIDDLHSIITHMHTLCGYQHIVLWGRSMGAVTSLLYSLKYSNPSSENEENSFPNYIRPHRQSRTQVVGMVIDSAFSSFGEVSKEMIGQKVSSFFVGIVMKYFRNKLRNTLKGLDLFSIELTSQMSQLKQPAIFVYSNEDKVVLPRHTFALFQQYGGAIKEKVQYQGDHNVSRGTQCFDHIISFINRNMVPFTHQPNQTINYESQTSRTHINPHQSLYSSQIQNGCLNFDKKEKKSNLNNFQKSLNLSYQVPNGMKSSLQIKPNDYHNSTHFSINENMPPAALPDLRQLKRLDSILNHHIPNNIDSAGERASSIQPHKQQVFSNNYAPPFQVSAIGISSATCPSSLSRIRQQIFPRTILANSQQNKLPDRITLSQNVNSIAKPLPFNPQISLF